MEIEQKQSEVMEQFIALAKTARGRAAAELIVHATSYPCLFTFAELLSVPHILELQGTEHSKFLDLLRVFVNGTWADYKNHASRLPSLQIEQEVKLKQLTVLTLAETAKVLPYDLLMNQLDVSNVRELEDLLINDCMCAGIVSGKLDQLHHCFDVHFAAGRDLRPGQLESMIQTLRNCLTTSDNLLLSLQDKIKWADSMDELSIKHRKEVADKFEVNRKSIYSRQKRAYGNQQMWIRSTTRGS